MHLPQYGIDIISGPPGSGKSYVVTKWILEIVTQQRRPIFTNHPLRWRLVRKYLRDRWGEEVAGLIKPLTKRHFLAFIDRAEAKKDFLEARREHLDEQGKTYTTDSLQADWEAEHGPDRLEDENLDDLRANWITPAAVIFIDELQNWFPMRNQKEEPEALLRYLSMHRHMMHWFRCITQDPMLISITVRRLANVHWKVANNANFKLAWGIKWRHVVKAAFTYQAWDAIALQAERRSEKHEPFATFCVIASLPWNRFIFRLYRSFTSAESPRKLLESVSQARIDAGLTKGGHTPKEVEMITRRTRKKAFSLTRLVFVLVRRTVLVVLLVLLGAGVGFAIGTLSSPDTPSPTAAEAEPTTVEEFAWPKLLSVSSRNVTLSTGSISLGGAHDGATLLLSDPRRGVCVWRLFDEYFVQRLGSNDPIRMGTLDDVRDLLEDAEPGGSSDLRSPPDDRGEPTPPLRDAPSYRPSLPPSRD